MSWEGLQDFLSMGGYAFYVWGSFGMATLMLAGEVLHLRRKPQHDESEPQNYGSEP